MILNSLQNGPLVWPTVVEKDGTTRTKKYKELSVSEKLQADCDLKAINIVLQGLPPDVYAIVNHHKFAKEIWDRVKLLIQGTKLSLQEKECKLYDEFDKFSIVKGETLYQYYWRFDQLINNMDVFNMSMRQVQVDTKFLNSLPPEWSKFMTDMKLARDLHTTNYDQLYSYLEQHEAHANETRFMRLAVPVFNQGDDLISCLNKAVAFLTHVASSRFPSTNNQLKTSSNLRNQATIQDGRVTVQQVQGREGKSYVGNSYKGSDFISEVPHHEPYHTDMDNQSVHTMQEKKIKELDNIVYKVGQSAQTMHMLTKPQVFYDDTHKQALGYQNLFYLKKAQRIKPTLYDGSVISSQHVASPVIDDEETLILKEASRSKMLAKQNDPMSKEKKVNTTLIKYVESNQLSEDFGKRFVQQKLSGYKLHTLILTNLLHHLSKLRLLGNFLSESCVKCLNLDAELLNKQNAYNDLLKSYSQLEKHCISLESRNLSKGFIKY
nr:hypothetical protein [Tanacetum cinerariifolium]